MRFPKCCFLLLLLAGCASTPTGTDPVPASENSASPAESAAPVLENRGAEKRKPKGETGLLDVHVTDVGGAQSGCAG